MRQTPSLGPSRREALIGAYRLGYRHFDSAITDIDEMLPEDTTFEEVQQTEALNLSDFESIRVMIAESSAMRRLWWALADYYQEHRSAEEYQRFQREATVAEDYDTAFRAGAYAALRGEDCAPEDDLSFFLDTE